MFFGIILIVIGVAMILEKFGVVSGEIWGYLTGAAILLIGLKMVLKKGHCRGDKNDK